MFPVRAKITPEIRMAKDRQWLMNFFLEFDELSECASRILRNPLLRPTPELTDLADKAHEFRDALLALQDRVIALDEAISGEKTDVL